MNQASDEPGVRLAGSLMNRASDFLVHRLNEPGVRLPGSPPENTIKKLLT